MVAPVNTQKYLEEIRREVCSRCVEKPPGGPPCAPLGKRCGIETHLPELIQSVRRVRSLSIVPYLDENRERICTTCADRPFCTCPCPMDYLAVLLVEAIEAVDERAALRQGIQAAP
jgi:hypothetical protein